MDAAEREREREKGFPRLPYRVWFGIERGGQIGEQKKGRRENEERERGGTVTEYAASGCSCICDCEDAIAFATHARISHSIRPAAHLLDLEVF